MPKIDRGDYSIHYEVSKNFADESLPVFLFSHPLGSHLGVWDAQVAVLSNDYRFIRYDHPGHGKSTMWNSLPDISQYGEDAVAILDQLEIENVTFCGLSLGGMVGQWLAAYYPGRIEKLIIANTCSIIENKELLKKRIALLEETSDLTQIYDSVINGWLTESFQKSNPSIREQELSRLQQISAAAYAATAKVICNLDLRDCVLEIDCPTTVIAGTHDQATPPAWNRKLTDAIPSARYQELDAAHLSNVEAEKAFNDLLLQNE